ncbi:hypothetical protein [Halosimplex halophilum]|uniref:hypothetical protein n=1 Tax=Halosimplex halophilum TaxID=2559572 RepID=UPI0014355FBA|nr:hypothetical protein [Halosimplex halophilum]
MTGVAPEEHIDAKGMKILAAAVLLIYGLGILTNIGGFKLAEAAFQGLASKSRHEN